MGEQTLLVRVVSEQYIAHYLYAATSIVQVYDTLLTFGDELTYIWGSNWSPIKVVFLIVRYLPISINSFVVVASKLMSDLLCSVGK